MGRDDQKKMNWDEANSRSFLDYGRYFVPERERQIAIIADLIPPPPTNALLVEVCPGEGLLARALLERFPGCRLLALDGSAEMRAKTQLTCHAFADRLKVAAFELGDHDWRVFSEPPYAIVSSLAIHHLDGQEKRTLFADLEVALASDGVLVIADLVRPTSERGFKLAAQQWDDAVCTNALAVDGNLGAFTEFQRLGWNYFRDPDRYPIDKPSSLPEQLAWLTEAGFTAVDGHWLFAGHAIFSAQKR